MFIKEKVINQCLQFWEIVINQVYRSLDNLLQCSPTLSPNLSCAWSSITTCCEAKVPWMGLTKKTLYLQVCTLVKVPCTRGRISDQCAFFLKFCVFHYKKCCNNSISNQTFRVGSEKDKNDLIQKDEERQFWEKVSFCISFRTNWALNNTCRKKIR